MKGSAHFVVRCVYIYAFIREISYTNWLISLGSDMDHIYSGPINGKNICSILDKILNKLDIAVKRCKVKSSKSIISLSIKINEVC